jgi:NADPH:quinone reductase-like Zn-dependent oxidoreductase
MTADLTTPTLPQVPPNVPMQAAVTVPNNLVTAWHLFGANLDIHLPFPKPEGYTAPNRHYPILVWGGATSVGQYALQLFRYIGYTRVVATASPRHHELLKKLGATECVDYGALDAVEILKRTLGDAPVKVLDCVGDAEGSIQPIAEVVSAGSVVAVVLPVIVRHASEQHAPEYIMDAAAGAHWPPGVDVRGIRAQIYPNVRAAATSAPLVR